MQKKTEHDCGRRPCSKEWAVAKLGLDPIEEQFLEIARHIFQSFATPATQGWINGLMRAQHAFGHDGPFLFARIVDALQAVRCARSSCFMFNSATCPCCAKIATEHERRLILAFAAIRRGQMGCARTELMMLCEGAETAQAVRALHLLATHLPSPDVQPAQTQAAT
ncbi:MAG: hypothetical protein AAGA70_11400 [Pseudomonadota bacterium]